MSDGRRMTNVLRTIYPRTLLLLLFLIFILNTINYLEIKYPPEFIVFHHTFNTFNIKYSNQTEWNLAIQNPHNVRTRGRPVGAFGLSRSAINHFTSTHRDSSRFGIVNSQQSPPSTRSRSASLKLETIGASGTVENGFVEVWEYNYSLGIARRRDGRFIRSSLAAPLSLLRFVQKIYLAPESRHT
jgi:hypothetical protein